MHAAPGGACAFLGRDLGDCVDGRFDVGAGAEFAKLRDRLGPTADRRPIIVSQRGDFGTASATANSSNPGTADAPSITRHAPVGDSHRPDRRGK